VRRAIEILALVLAIGVVAALAWTREAPPPSTYSTNDTGPNGYEALYNVLRAEGVPVSRFTDPLALLPPGVRVLVVTSTWFDNTGGYDAADRKRLAAFVKNGGRLVACTDANDPMHGKYPLKTIRLDAGIFRNVALEARPANALLAYAVVAGRGNVAFDEHVHGYGTDRSIWSVLPPSVRTACVLVLIALIVALIGTNTRWIPALAAEPPGDRDSSDYIASMARLLRRACAPHVAYDRKDHS
jgi:Domain of unknown function (DUF4350)